MNIYSQKTLRRVAQNDPSLTILRISNFYTDGVAGEFYSDNDNYSTLGAAIANNTHLAKLEVHIDDLPLTVADNGFFNRLKNNTSIINLELWCYSSNIAGGVGQEILKAYQENNNHLTVLRIYNANLQNGGDIIIGDTLRSCRNLQSVTLYSCSITDEQLWHIVDAVRGHRLEELTLYDNNIGDAGCEAIAALLIDPNCNLRTLGLGSNPIDNEGATVIANCLLSNNNKLQCLDLGGNQIARSVQDVFSNILCNTSNINYTYSSNHTLRSLYLPQEHGQHLASLLSLNRNGNNKVTWPLKRF